jgi:hypothetical protein
MFFSSKLKKKSLKKTHIHLPKIFWAVFGLSCLLLFFFPQVTFAADWGEKYILVPILKVMLKVSWLVFSAAKTIFEWIIVPDNMTTVMDNTVVYEMWLFVRDFFNTMLIMILLFSAFATIFQASASYHYKKVLLNLVLMALLVNFSYPIARFIIDLSNIFMYDFLNQMEGSKSFWTVIQNSGLNKIIGGKNADPAYLLSAVIFTFMFAITMLTIAILLIIRTIALTVFIIFSPIAFLGSTQPGSDLANASSDWWKEFMKYCFSGPIMIFMLVLASRMMVGTTEAFKGLTSLANVEAPNNADLSSAIASVSFFALPLVILWIGITKAQSSGIAGANMVVGQGTKAMKWAGKNLTGYRLAKYGATAGIKKLDRKTIGVGGAIAAWKIRSKEKHEDETATQTAKWRDRMGGAFDKVKKDPNYYRDVDDATKTAKYKKEQDLYSTDAVKVMAGIKKLEGRTDKESGQRVKAYFQTLAEQKDNNEWANAYAGGFDPIRAKESIAAQLRTNLKNEDDVADTMHDLQDTNLMNGLYSMGVMTATDKDGKRRILDKDDQIKYSLAKMKQIDYQKMMINFHRNSVTTENEKGKITGLSEFGIEALKFIESQDSKFAERWRGENKEAILAAIKAQSAKNIAPGEKGSIDTAEFSTLMQALEGDEDTVKDARKSKREAKAAKSSTNTQSSAQPTSEPIQEPEPEP